MKGSPRTIPEQVAAKPHPGEERQCISICGIPGHPVEGVTLSDIHVTYPGGGTRKKRRVATCRNWRISIPEYFMFGVLPAYGLYARMCEGLTLDNVRLELASPDAAPGRDVRRCRGPGGLGSARPRDVRCGVADPPARDTGAFIHGSRPLGDIDTFVRVEGEASRDITLTRQRPAPLSNRGADRGWSDSERPLAPPRRWTTSSGAKVRSRHGAGPPMFEKVHVTLASRWWARASLSRACPTLRLSNRGPDRGWSDSRAPRSRNATGSQVIRVVELTHMLARCLMDNINIGATRGIGKSIPCGRAHTTSLAWE